MVLSGGRDSIDGRSAGRKAGRKAYDGWSGALVALGRTQAWQVRRRRTRVAALVIASWKGRRGRRKATADSSFVDEASPGRNRGHCFVVVRSGNVNEPPLQAHAGNLLGGVPEPASPAWTVAHWARLGVVGRPPVAGGMVALVVAGAVGGSAYSRERGAVVDPCADMLERAAFDW